MDFLTIPDTYYENLRARLKHAPIAIKEDLDVVSTGIYLKLFFMKQRNPNSLPSLASGLINAFS